MEIEFDDFESNLVVNAFLTDSESLNIHVSHSGNVLDNRYAVGNVNDAQVFLRNLEDKSVIEFFSVDNGNYSSNGIKPVAGVEYELNVNAAGFQEVRAIDRIPVAPVLNNLVKDSITLNDREGLQVNFSLQAQQDSENFYVWDLVDVENDFNSIFESYNEPIDIIEQAWVSSVKANANSYIDDRYEGVLPDRILLGSDDFINSTYDASFLSFGKQGPTLNTNSDRDGNSTVVDTLNNVTSSGPINKPKKLRVIAVSKTLFDYINSIEEYRLSQDASSAQSSPAALFDNISGGYGIFGAYSLIEIEL